MGITVHLLCLNWWWLLYLWFSDNVLKLFIRVMNESLFNIFNIFFYIFIYIVICISLYLLVLILTLFFRKEIIVMLHSVLKSSKINAFLITYFYWHCERKCQLFSTSCMLRRIKKNIVWLLKIRCTFCNLLLCGFDSTTNPADYFVNINIYIFHILDCLESIVF